MRSGCEVHVFAVQSGQLRGPEPCLDRGEQHRVVAAAGPGRAVGSGEQRVDLVLVEERDCGSVRALRRDRQYPLDVMEVFGVSEGGVSEQRVDRCQAGVAGADAVAALALEVVEERGDQWRVQVADVELAWRVAKTRCGEREQQLERVAVGGDRVRAGAPLPDQPLGEERLQRRRERAHRWPPWERSSLPAASSSSSGAAVRYQ